MTDAAYRRALARLVDKNEGARRARMECLRDISRAYPFHLGPFILSLRSPARSPDRFGYDTAWGWCWFRVTHVVGPFWWRSAE